MYMGLLFALFLFVLLLGGSVAFAMVSCSAIYMSVNGLPFMLMGQRLVAGANSFVLLAIPFFILASNIMNSGGVTDRIFNFANRAVGWVPGGLGHANIVASVIFAGMSGSAVADAAGLGKIGDERLWVRSEVCLGHHGRFCYHRTDHSAEYPVRALRCSGKPVDRQAVRCRRDSGRPHGRVSWHHGVH